MRAVFVRRSSDPRFVIDDAPPPHQGDTDTVVDVEFISLNPGEIKALDRYPDNSRVGWDFAGTVHTPALDGTGPDIGARVVGTVKRGAWSERLACPSTQLSVVPDDLELELAVCLPVPAMTAFVALRCAGLLYGKRVLVTGAAGAVGQYACQLALGSGAHVSAAVRRETKAHQVRSHGVEDVRVTTGIAAFRDDIKPFDLILDVVGPGVAEDAATLLAPGGVYAVVSAAGGEALSLPIPPMLSAAGQLRVINLFAEIASGPDSGSSILDRLVTAAAAGLITVPVGPRGIWNDIDEIARTYLDAEDRGKPVLSINGGAS